MFGFFRRLFKKIINFFKPIHIIYKLFFLVCSRIKLLFILKFLNFVDEEFISLDSKRESYLNEDNVNYMFYVKNDFKNHIQEILFAEKNFFFIDSLAYVYFSLKYLLFNNDSNLFRSYFRVLNSRSGFYFNFFKLKNNLTFFDSLKNIFMSGVKFIWIGFKFWFIPLILGFIVIYYSMVLRCLPFNKIIVFWIIFGMISYWLLSGFVFFIKKYQYGKYTSAIQRFWRRSYILFWLIEFSLFGVYVYLTLNANQESFYMFDQIQVFKTHLFSWRSFLLKIFPLTLLLLLGYFLLLSLKWNIINKNSFLMVLITLIIVNVVWTEFYQFFHVINYYGNFNWVYEADEKMWSLELEPRKTRTLNHYVMLLLILKFWHIVLIVAFWIFFVLRGLEIGRIRYPLLSANLQNFLILYLFAWVNMFPWFKFILRRYIDSPYYWFYVNNRDLFYRIFFSDLKLFYYGLVDLCSFFSFSDLRTMINCSFIGWSVDNDDFLFSYRKSHIKNLILSSLEIDYNLVK